MKLTFPFILFLFTNIALGEIDRWHPGELLLRCEQLPANTAEFADRLGVAAALPLGGNWMQLKLAGETVLQAQERLSAEGLIVQPNFVYSPRDTPNDTRFAEQYASDLLRLTDAWDLSLGATDGNSGYLIAVVDNGVDYTHVDLSGNVWDGTHCVTETGDQLDNCVHGYDFANDDRDPAPVEGHGTHVAGIIAATGNNSQGISGVTRSGQVIALRTDLSTAQVVRAINFAASNGARILNLSWGFGASTCEAVFDQALYNAIADFDGLVVVAAGDNNEEHDLGTWFDIADFAHDTGCWSALGNVISVTATDSTDARGSSADYGTGVDIAAPGVDILSTEPGNTYANRSGSSMAAAHVSGVAALLWGAQPEFGGSDVRRFLLENADTISTDQGDMLRLNAYAPLARLAQPVPSNLRTFSDSSEQNLIYEGGSTVAVSPFFRWDAPTGAGIIDHYTIDSSVGSFTATDSFFDAAARGLSYQVGEHEFYVTAHNDAGGAGESLLTYFSITAPTVEFFESGSDVSEAATITIQVALSQPAAVNASITVQLSIDDEPLTEKILIWDAGTSGIRSFTIASLDNDLVDGDRSISGTLADPVNVLIGQESEVGFNVADNDPRIGVNISDASAIEDQVLIFDFQLTSPAEVPVSFSYQLTADSATPDDYSGAPTTVTLSIGNSTGTVVIPIIDDTDMEGPESFRIELTDLVGVQPDLSAGTAIGSIVDNDIALDLEPGWNLVGLPLQPSVARASLTEQVDVAWKWDAARQAYRRSDLSQAGAGYWVHVSSARQLSTTGTEAIAPAKHPGWNLISPLMLSLPARHSFGWDGSNLILPAQYELGRGYWLLVPRG